MDNAFKQKFENFAPAPPEHVWEGVRSGIAAPVTSSFFVRYWKPIAVAAIFIAAITAGIFYLTSVSKQNTSGVEKTLSAKDSSTKENNKPAADTQTASEYNKAEEIISDAEKVEQENLSSKALAAETEEIQKTAYSKQPDVDKKVADDTAEKTSENYHYTAEKHQENVARTDKEQAGIFKSGDLETDALKPSFLSELAKINHINQSIKSKVDPQIINPSFSEQFSAVEQPKFKKGTWSLGIYLTPEMMLNHFDSVEILTNYSIGIEPSYYFNNHLFIRFGLNASYSRDRGFANLDYLSYDLLGSYEYVYDITFDSIDGEVVPTYHTYNLDVWDTVRHLEISAITNKYYYIQTPLLVGYHNNTSNFRWYLYGGPAFNFMVSKQIDRPLDDVNYIELLNLQKELPERSPYFFQLWIGAGIEYKAGQNLGISFEPNYRYYFNNVYKETPYKNTGLSGLSLRFGLTYTIH